jgi:hypothetical protein
MPVPKPLSAIVAGRFSSASIVEDAAMDISLGYWLKINIERANWLDYNSNAIQTVSGYNNNSRSIIILE